MENTAQQLTQTPEEQKVPVAPSVPPKKRISYKLFLVGFLIVAVIAVAFILVKFKPWEKKSELAEIVVGFNANQTNPGTSSFGISARLGFMLAIDEINEKGGLLGRKIKPVILDDNADPVISRKNMEQLIYKDKAIAVVGPANSGSALNWLDLAQDNETIVIVPIATATEITQRYKDRLRNYIFRITSLDSDQATLYVSWLVNKTKNGKIAIIHDSTSYGVNGIKDIINTLSRWGKIPSLVSSFDRGTPVPQLVKLIQEAKAVGADGICFFGLADSTADLVKALSQVPGYKPYIAGTAAAGDPKFWALAGPLATKLTFAGGKNLDIDYSVFIKKIKDRYGKQPTANGSAIAAYDSVQFLRAAVNKAGTFDGKSVQEALENIKNIQGAIDNFEKPYSKSQHEAWTINDLGLAHWKDGKIVKLEEDESQLEIR